MGFSLSNSSNSEALILEHMERLVDNRLRQVRIEFEWRQIEEAILEKTRPNIAFLYAEKSHAFLGSKHVAFCACPKCPFHSDAHVLGLYIQKRSSPYGNVDKNLIYIDPTTNRHFGFCKCSECRNSELSRELDRIFAEKKVIVTWLWLTQDYLEAEAFEVVDNKWQIGLASQMEYMTAGFELLRSIRNGCMRIPETYHLSLTGSGLLLLKKLRANEGIPGGLSDYMIDYM